MPSTPPDNAESTTTNGRPWLRSLIAAALLGVVAFLTTCLFFVDETELRDARLALASATGQVLRNGLSLMGVSAPEKM